MMASLNAGHVTGIASFVGYLIILANLFISSANRAYGLIHEIPDKVLRYIGSQAETLGEAKHEGENRHAFVAATAHVRGGHGHGGHPGSKQQSGGKTNPSENSEEVGTVEKGKTMNDKLSTSDR
jgi:hypothetical protein